MLWLHWLSPPHLAEDAELQLLRNRGGEGAPLGAVVAREEGDVAQHRADDMMRGGAAERGREQLEQRAVVALADDGPRLVDVLEEEARA